MKELKIGINTILILVVIVLFSFNLIKIFPSIMGYNHAFTIKGGSMEPSILAGDLILLSELSPEQVKSGNIVTVERPEGVYTHRVVEVREFRGEIFLQTKGDANEGPDPGLVPFDMVIGEVSRVLPLHLVYSNEGFILLVLSPVIVMTSSISWRFLSESKRRNRRQLIKYSKRKPPVIGSTSMLLFLIFSMSCVNFMSPYVMGWSFTDFNDLEESSGTLSSGEWLNVKNAVIDLDPDTLNLKSHGPPITCYIEFDEVSALYLVDASKIKIEALNNSMLLKPIYANPDPVEIEDYDGDDVPDLKVQFERITIIETLKEQGYEPKDCVEFKLFGWLLNGDAFRGSDTLSTVGDYG
jgi:signal peptidase I